MKIRRRDPALSPEQALADLWSRLPEAEADVELAEAEAKQAEQERGELARIDVAVALGELDEAEAARRKAELTSRLVLRRDEWDADPGGVSDRLRSLRL